MLKALFTALLSLILFLASFLGLHFPGLPAPVPCSVPLTYTIGSFDRRFSLKQGDFLKALSEAEAVWEGPMGKNLFVYASTTGEVTVNLVYDYREQATQQLTAIKTGVKETEADYRAMEARYKTLKESHDSLQASYDTRAAAFDTANTQYEKDVTAWNASSRTDAAQFDALEAERRALESQAAELKAVEKELNAVVALINPLVSDMNSLAKDLNLNVAQYNAIGRARGETFAGGTYTEDASGRRIDIFEFENHAKLVRVLAHELGHALGLDHVSDPKAIMYYLNEGSAAQATPADLAAVKKLCGVQ